MGGRTPNENASAAVAVPEKYAGYLGLPPATTPDPDSGADSHGFIALDVNVSLPDPRRFPKPRHGYPMIALMHGCCSGSKADWHGTIDKSGEKWHYTDAWFAARGYVVLTWTARGFVDEFDDGSTGVSQLDSRLYEVNDFQYLAGLLAEDKFFGINPKKIVVSGGSYGGGFSWLALTDPTWRSPNKRISMRLVAAAPKYGWTDLVSSLVPNGRYRQDRPATTDAATAVSRSPIGTPKRSFITALYTSGKAGLPPPGPHATFSREIDQTFACLNSSDPFESNPLCGSTLMSVLDSFIRDRSAYLQSDYFARLATDPRARVPVYSAGTLSDQLFPMEEHRRMQRMLRSIVPNYPIQEYYGDYNHAVQNKAKEWGDVCGPISHVCQVAEYKRGFNNPPRRLQRVGVTTRLNRFIDHYARPPGNARQPAPRFDVTVSLQTCRQNASSDWPLDEPGQRFNAPSIVALAPHALRLDLPGDQTTTNKVSGNEHAVQSDPVANAVSNGATCPSHTDAAGPGVAVYDSQPLAGDTTMIGQTEITTDVTGTGNDLQLNARLYDLYPNGMQVLVDRGVYKLSEPSGRIVFDLHGNAWRFPKGHRLRLELAQDDDPYVKSSNQPGSLTIHGVKLAMPIREIAPGNPGDAGPTVRLSVKRRSAGRFKLTARSMTGERTGIAGYEFSVTDGGYVSPLDGPADSPYRTYDGAPHQRYVFAARAIDLRGVPGPLAYWTGRGRD